MCRSGAAPVLVSSQNTNRDPNEEAQRRMQLIETAVEVIKNILGPHGIDKLLMDPGSIVISTNDVHAMEQEIIRIRNISNIIRASR